jgi:DNA-binding transcriptional LysR family regulator
MVDFRPLNYFLVACEHENLGLAAKHLDIAPSTLSASLKALEACFGVSLFRNQAGGLMPRRFAHWLYRAAVPLLLLEDFARRHIAAPPGMPIEKLRLDIRLPFTLGHLSLALSKAMDAASRDDDSLVLIDPVWPLEKGATYGTMSLDRLSFDKQTSLVIEAMPRAHNPTTGEVLLSEDRWTTVRRRLGLSEVCAIPSPITGQTLIVPAFPPAMLDQITRHAKTQRIKLEMSASPPGDWPQLLDESPGAAVLLPESAVRARLGTSRIDATPLDPPLACSIVAHTDGSPTAARFAERLRDAFNDDGPGPVFEPKLTSRRLRYFNIAYDLGRVSAAARAASVAQPALSQQLHKLEDSLGTTLFDRHSFGLVRTKAGEQFAPAADLLERRLRELMLSGSTASQADGGRLSLGVLPSVSQHGYLVNRITDAVLALREQYPTVSVAVREAPNGTLQTLVQRGGVGLAIVETALAQMPRLALGSSEELVVVADPRHRLLPPGPIRLADLAKLPLALPSSLYGIRTLLDTAAHSAGIDLQPCHEIDALGMLVALVAREPVATVLPASAVRPEVLSGELSVHPIIEPTINRRLFVIYSADRSLTPVERDLVVMLRSRLSGGNQAGIETPQLPHLTSSITDVPPMDIATC